MCTNTRTSWITALTGSRTSKHSGRTSTGQQQTTYSSVHLPYGYSILTCCCGNVPSLQTMKLRRTDGSTRGNLQVDARLGRNHLDRTPLFLQLGEWTISGEDRRTDKKGGQSRTTSARSVLVSMG